jgi:hypothetical protein
LPACFWRLEHVHGFDDGRIRASMAAFVVAGAAKMLSASWDNGFTLSI